jgi:hypothetical protein
VNEFVEELETGNDGKALVEVSKGVSVAINYDADSGRVVDVWACAGNEITGSDDVNLACYDPTMTGNVADEVEYSPVIICNNGGSWEVAQ